MQQDPSKNLRRMYYLKKNKKRLIGGIGEGGVRVLGVLGALLRSCRASSLHKTTPTGGNKLA